MNKGDKVRVKTGKLPCSEYRPREGREGYVAAIHTYSVLHNVAVMFPDATLGVLSYHESELEVIEP